MGIEVRNITKTFGAFTALKDVNLSVATGELVALLGPSGSGKTTLLRIIAGLEEPDAGSGAILFHDEDVARRNVGKRQVGFVFQHYALFRHMNVFENVAFGLRVRPKKLRPGRNLIKYKVMRLLKLVQLESMAHRYPHQLSGGQRQRVALAPRWRSSRRCCCWTSRSGARRQGAEGAAAVAAAAARRDSPDERLRDARPGGGARAGRPRAGDERGANRADRHARRGFSQAGHRVRGEVSGRGELLPRRLEGGKVHFATLALESPEHAGTPTQAASVFIRPHQLDVDVTRNGHPALQAVVTRIHSAGPNVRLELTAESGERLHAELTQERYRSLKIANGSTVYVTPREVKVFADKPH